ncbi:M28 family peptidase [Pedobacter sp. SAFR-022]|uniref:M28 family peptidase n=1 Tax=Pedobacter sp. SAFR-022 TaxID=3436861 RepID=UPI003F7CF938
MKKQIVYTSLALLLGFGACAQDRNAIKFSQSISKDNAYKHLSVLASDEYEGRETGKKGAWMAADYIRTQFKSLGLTAPVNGSYFQPVGLATYSLSQTVFTINGTPMESMKDFVIQPNYVGLKGFTFNAAEVLFAGYGLNKGEYNDYAGQNVSGKVVMIFASGDPTQKDAAAPADRAAMRKAMAERQAKLSYLMDNNAAGIILIDPALDNISPEMKARYEGAGQMVLLKAANVERMQNQKLPNVVSVNTATANQILKASGLTVDALQKQITAAGKPATKVVKADVSASAMKKEEKLRADNVLGFLEGSDPKLKSEVLVISAHYDHEGLTTSGDDKVFNGADDDGSGTTGVIMMAEAFAKAKKAGKGPKRSILFLAVVGEEKGLLGSDWYSENPIFPLKNTIADLNIDMIGRTGTEYQTRPDSTNYIYVIGSDKLSTELRQISEAANKTYTKLHLDYKFDDPNDTERIYYRSDHYNFAKHGIPIIFYFNGVHEDYHKASDEVSKINFPLLAKRAQLAYYTAWELANRATRPVVDKTDTTPAR